MRRLASVGCAVSTSTGVPTRDSRRRAHTWNPFIRIAIDCWAEVAEPLLHRVMEEGTAVTGLELSGLGDGRVYAAGYHPIARQVVASVLAAHAFAGRVSTAGFVIAYLVCAACAIVVFASAFALPSRQTRRPRSATV